MRLNNLLNKYFAQLFSPVLFVILLFTLLSIVLSILTNLPSDNVSIFDFTLVQLTSIYRNPNYSGESPIDDDQILNDKNGSVIYNNSFEDNYTYLTYDVFLDFYRECEGYWKDDYSGKGNSTVIVFKAKMYNKIGETGYFAEYTTVLGDALIFHPLMNRPFDKSIENYLKRMEYLLDPENSQYNENNQLLALYAYFWKLPVGGHPEYAIVGKTNDNQGSEMDDPIGDGVAMFRNNSFNLNLTPFSTFAITDPTNILYILAIVLLIITLFNLILNKSKNNLLKQILISSLSAISNFTSSINFLTSRLNNRLNKLINYVSRQHGLLKVIGYEYNNNGRFLNIFLHNEFLEDHDKVLPLIFNTLKNDEKFIKMGYRKVFIITALMDDKFLSQFNYHPNVLINNDSSFKEYLEQVEEHIKKLYVGLYPIDTVPTFKVTVWNMDLVSNKSIKINQFKKPIARGYHTKTSNNVIKPLKVKNSIKSKLFATMDLETIDLKGIQTPICITTAYNINDSKIFLIDKDLIKIDSDEAVSQLWKNYFNFIVENSIYFKTVFVHNLGSFDGYFLYKALSSFLPPESISTIIDDNNKFIQIVVKYNNVKIVWKDSYRIFPLKLSDLCNNFNVVGKLSEYNIDYNNLDLFNSPELLDNFKKYSIQDSVALLNALVNAQEIYISKYNIDLAETSIVSTSSLSLKIFRTHFLTHNIPILKNWEDVFIRKSYLGGATDYYKAYGKQLHYYDVNSLYPFAMCNPMPFEIIKEYKDMNSIKLENFFGFCLAIVESPKDILIPILPYKYNGKTIFPSGKWIDVYFSEELKAVEAHGYKITLIRGYEFSKIDLFSGYVKHFFENKKNAKSPAERLIAKMHLNQLYGVFGRKLELIETINIYNRDLLKYLSSRIVKNVITISPEISALLLLNNINNHIRNELNTSLELTLDSKFTGSIKSNVAIASAVTSYARIHMMQYKLNGSIYYTDTDSIFVDKPLNSTEIGKGLGLMKDELEGLLIEEAYFLGIKRYGYFYKNCDNETISKSVFAGIKRNSLTFDEIKSIFNGSVLVKQVPNRFYKSFSNLNISIKSAFLTLQMNNDKELFNNVYLPKKINNLNHDLDNRPFFLKLKRKVMNLIKKYLS